MFFGTVHSQWLSKGQESSLSKVHIAANHSEPVPDSPKYVGNQGYHPLEELKDHDRSKNLMLSDAQIARSTVQANSHAMLVFPGELHNEPHERETWAEFEYVVDDYGDIFIEIFHDENILNDRWTSNPVHAFIGMDIDKYLVNQRPPQNDGDGRGTGYEFTLEYDHKEIVDSDITDTLIDRGMPETLRHIHPIYFVKCLTQSSISGKEFHNAEPDILAHSALALIDHFNQYGTMFTAALKALCRKKKHLDVEVKSESAAEKKIRRMLFPRYHRKNHRTPLAEDGQEI
ncbi:hypothetical protein QJS04_geneDACA016652 [Acorus gramineus]|uniref:Uncharacterized protein n=1 Tax=Acorus gramineus TaxID=55184 RepID=A0AAV9ANC7_ACOGR|nr:hypothetical protein QJS04_geneDACA016652 [Acorus gramineus]